LNCRPLGIADRMEAECSSLYVSRQSIIVGA
jgi:hypothetical protein